MAVYGSDFTSSSYECSAKLRKVSDRCGVASRGVGRTAGRKLVVEVVGKEYMCIEYV